MEAPLLRRRLPSCGVRNGRRRRRSWLLSHPALLVLATLAHAQASGRASLRSRSLQWPLTSAVKSRHISGVVIAAWTSSRGTRSSLTFSQFTPSLVLLRTLIGSRRLGQGPLAILSPGRCLHHYDLSREVNLLAHQSSLSGEFLTFRPLMAQPSRRGVGRGRIFDRSRIFHEQLFGTGSYMCGSPGPASAGDDYMVQNAGMYMGGSSGSASEIFLWNGYGCLLRSSFGTNVMGSAPH